MTVSLFLVCCECVPGMAADIIMLYFTTAAMKSRSNSQLQLSADEDSAAEEFALSTSTPVTDMNKASGGHKKSTAASYDIDDIVIPYHIAASTRVEKLQYKEIDTPRSVNTLVVM